MEDIIVNSAIDFKTYLGIVYRTYFAKRIFLIIGIAFVVSQIFLLTQPHIDWPYEFQVLTFFIGFYGLLIPILMYFAAKNSFKKTAFLREPLLYSINEEKIEVKGDTFSSNNNWQYITKLVEREKYFMVRTGSRAFHYLPKDGFKSREDISRLKSIAKEKSIKFSYK
ncbi:YcxB family protein [Mucilaginibacter dorajii]|uniref:YcxB-like C-terminal domain-containing protein n=1 Tax=Mucilaginibacter dorajii TaxID=692994 RepID=A0ABP7P9C0_9SPHI|nr:YcxB family protein [Mucilaginibacter dorajii]MCS3735252.1 hypothetical protein [Mucilaginibacter dorajii]